MHWSSFFTSVLTRLVPRCRLCTSLGNFLHLTRPKNFFLASSRTSFEKFSWPHLTLNFLPKFSFISCQPFFCHFSTILFHIKPCKAKRPLTIICLCKDAHLCSPVSRLFSYILAARLCRRMYLPVHKEQLSVRCGKKISQCLTGYSSPSLCHREMEPYASPRAYHVPTCVSPIFVTEDARVGSTCYGKELDASCFYLAMEVGCEQYCMFSF